MKRFLSVMLFATTTLAGETMKEPELSPSQAETLRRKLHETRLPKIAFDQSTVRDAIEFLVTKIHGTEADFGLNLRLALSESVAAPALKPSPGGIPGLDEAPVGQVPSQRELSEPRITLHATNVPVDKILDEVCRQAGLQWKLTFYGVLITPAPSKNRRGR